MFIQLEVFSKKISRKNFTQNQKGINVRILKILFVSLVYIYFFSLRILYIFTHVHFFVFWGAYDIHVYIVSGSWDAVAERFRVYPGWEIPISSSNLYWMTDWMSKFLTRKTPGKNLVHVHVNYAYPGTTCSCTSSYMQYQVLPTPVQPPKRPVFIYLQACTDYLLHVHDYVNKLHKLITCTF